MSQVNQPGAEVILEARNITKRYPGNVALDCVTFRVYRGQVNVLIGENGAGKSTLMRILAGAEKADEGTLLLEGRPVALHAPRDAAAIGISIVYQELLALTNLKISENIFAGRELCRAALFVDQETQDQRSTAALNHLRKPMDVSIETGRLSLGCRQVVEIARALDQGSRILILDEPTSALSASEAESLFEVIADLKRAGVTIIYISHRLHELLHLGDRFTVLRSGRVVGEAIRADATRAWIVERMSGRKEGAHDTSSTSSPTRTVVLTVSGLTLPGSVGDEAAQAPVHDVSFSVREGEILGVYGLLGAGRTELLEALAGLRPIASGVVAVRGRKIRTGNVRDALRAGMVLMPEDRQRDGLFPELSIRENVVMAAKTGLFLSRDEETERACKLVAQLHIAAKDVELPVTTLSGGNQQKVLLARCLMCSPSVLLMDEPTRGVDVSAKAEIYGILRELAAKGLSIVFTSSEIEETQALAHRVLVLCQGRISAEFARDQLSDDGLFAAASPSVAAAAGAALARPPGGTA
ncbi:MAG: sugar ABC transporter ATP-binding protein [Terracidiphilus sp.]|nr:sugar ABC transporter ATP-binding protein [Terracidiphilus sp.]